MRGPNRRKPYLFSADEIRCMLAATMELSRYGEVGLPVFQMLPEPVEQQEGSQSRSVSHPNSCTPKFYGSPAKDRWQNGTRRAPRLGRLCRSRSTPCSPGLQVEPIPGMSADGVSASVALHLNR